MKDKNRTSRRLTHAACAFVMLVSLLLAASAPLHAQMLRPELSGGSRPELLYTIDLVARRAVNGESLAGATIHCKATEDPGEGQSFVTTQEPFRVTLFKDLVYEFEMKDCPENYTCWGHHRVQCKFENDYFWIKSTMYGDEWKLMDSQELVFFLHKDWPILLGKEAADKPGVQQENAHLRFGWPGEAEYFSGLSGAKNFPKEFVISEGIFYTFSELEVPTGYKKSDDIVFGLNEFGDIQLNEGSAKVTNRTESNAGPPLLTMINRKTSDVLPNKEEIRVLAKRMVNGDCLEGASIRYYDVDKPEHITAFITKTTATKIMLERGKVYRFEETRAPIGYQCWGPNPLECKIDEKGDFYVKDPQGTMGWKKTDPREIYFCNYKEMKVTLSKLDEDMPSEQLAGATLRLGWPGYPEYYTGASGAPEFPKTLNIVEKIPYTFSELEAPQGYFKAEDIVFHLDERGDIVIESGAGYQDSTTPLAAPPVLVMTNKKNPALYPLYSLDIMAKRQITGENLAGAEIKYYDLADPDYIMTTESSTEAWGIELKRGAIYRFEESKAPAGYQCWGPNPLECMLDGEDRFFVRGTEKDAQWKQTDKRELIFFNYKERQVFLSKEAGDVGGKRQSGASMKFGWPGEPDYFSGDSGSDAFKKAFDIVEAIPYTLSEVAAPDTYEKHADIVFHLDKDGAIVIESGEGKILPDAADGLPMLIMINKKKQTPTTTTTTTTTASTTTTTTTASTTTTPPTTTTTTTASTTTTPSTAQAIVTTPSTTPATKKTSIPSTKSSAKAEAKATTKSTPTQIKSEATDSQNNLQDKPDTLDVIDKVMKGALIVAGTSIVGAGAYYIIRLLRKRRG